MFRVFLITTILLLAACSDDQSSQETESKKQSVQNKSTVFDAQLDSLEKAKKVEGSLNEAVKERDKAMSDQGI